MTKAVTAKWKKFQKSEGLVADGIPGNATANAALSLVAKDAPDGDSGSFRDLMVNIGLKEIGVMEKPKNSNRGKRVQEYQSATWLDYKGFAWCAAFIDWIIRESIADFGGVAFDRPETAGAWDLENWAKGKARSGGKAQGVYLFEDEEIPNIEPGDILIYEFSHVGMAVEGQRGNTVDAVEGNTDQSGSREGGGVYRATRHMREIRSIIRINA